MVKGESCPYQEKQALKSHLQNRAWARRDGLDLGANVCVSVCVRMRMCVCGSPHVRQELYLRAVPQHTFGLLNPCMSSLSVDAKIHGGELFWERPWWLCVPRIPAFREWGQEDHPQRA